MCAIIDNNCRDQVFGRGDRPEAGKKFYDWLEKHGKLVVGGKLREELGGSGRFSQWFRQAILSGSVIDIDDDLVNRRTEELITENTCKSDDQHVIALAQISNARLLYSNESNLHDDFKSPELINNPRGKIYSTKEGGDFRDSHRNLLNNRNLCRN